MRMPKCLKNTIFFHPVITVWTFTLSFWKDSQFGSVKEHMRTKWLWRQHLRRTGSTMNHMSAPCADAGWDRFYSLAWRRTTCSNTATSQEIYNYYLHSSWVFATLQNFSWCFRKHVMFILCSAWQKETELSLSFKFKEVVCEGNKITSDLCCHFHGDQQILCVKPYVTEEWREKMCNLLFPPPA